VRGGGEKAACQAHASSSDDETGARRGPDGGAGAGHALDIVGLTFEVHGGRELRAAGSHCAGDNRGGRGGDIGGGERECGWGE
jgi:hypothetical protein